MVDNSWPLRLAAAAFATSLAGQAVAWAQQGVAADEPAADVYALVGNVEVTAATVSEGVTLEWRPLGPAMTGEAPQFRILGIPGVRVRPGTPRDTDPATLLFAIGGSEAMIARQLELAAVLAPSAYDRGARVELARLSPAFEVLAETRDGDGLRASLNTLSPSLLPSADTWRTVPDAFDHAMATGGRKAIFVEADAMPAEEDILFGIAEASIATAVYIFPVVAGAPGPESQLLAEVTGGRIVAANGSVEVDALLQDVFAGGALDLVLPVHRRYRLPGEAGTPLELAVTADGQSETFALGWQADEIGWTGVAVRGLDPRHWSGWLATPGRRTFGLTGLLATLGILGTAGLVLLRHFISAGPTIPVTDLERPEPARAAWQSWTIGRTSDCDMTLPDASVSRRHALLAETAEGLVLKDLGSTNGTFLLRGEAWERVGEAAVDLHDHVRFGTLQLMVQDLFTRYAEVSPAGKAGDDDSQEPGLPRFRKPRRNPYTGQIEEGG